MKRHLPALLPILLFTLITTLPHIINLLRFNDPAYFADSDDTQLYLTYASYAYHNNPLELREPITDFDRTFTPALQLLPAPIFAKAMGFSPLAIPILWRIFSGISIAIAFYLLCSFFLESAWLSAVAAALITTDCGLQHANFLIRQVYTFATIAFGDPSGLFSIYPLIYYHCRIITPGLSLAFLLFHVFIVLKSIQATDKQKNKYILAGILTFALLVPLYFYFWTTALLALGIAFIADKENRITFLKIASGGILFALPALYFNSKIKLLSHPDALPRQDFFLAIPHFSQLLLPRFAIGTLLISAALLINSRERKLLYPIIVASSALLLLNHQIFTGLQIQNFHYQYALGPFVYFTFLILLLKYTEKKLPQKKIIAALTIILLFSFSLGLYNRYNETIQTHESAQLLMSYQKIIKDKNISSKLLAPKSIIAGDEHFTTFSLVLFNTRPVGGMMLTVSPAISNHDWVERLALNEYFRGKDKETFEKEQHENFRAFQWGKWARDMNENERIYSDAMAQYLAIAANPMQFVDKFKIRYVVERVQDSLIAPAILSDPSAFRLVYSSGDWKIWQTATAASP